MKAVIVFSHEFVTRPHYHVLLTLTIIKLWFSHTWCHLKYSKSTIFSFSSRSSCVLTNVLDSCSSITHQLSPCVCQYDFLSVFRFTSSFLFSLFRLRTLATFPIIVLRSKWWIGLVWLSTFHCHVCSKSRLLHWFFRSVSQIISASYESIITYIESPKLLSHCYKVWNETLFWLRDSFEMTSSKRLKSGNSCYDICLLILRPNALLKSRYHSCQQMQLRHPPWLTVWFVSICTTWK